MSKLDNVNLDTPMYFTSDQKAWVKKYIINNSKSNVKKVLKEYTDKLLEVYHTDLTKELDDGEIVPLSLEEILNIVTNEIKEEWGIDS